MEIKVSTISGSGNIFSLIDNRNYHLNQDFYQTHAKFICNNSYSISPTEGLLILDNTTEPNTDFKVTFFNPDGSTGMMCGNGARCSVFFALHNNFFPPKNDLIKFSLANKIYSAKLEDNFISVFFEFPQKILLNMQLPLKNYSIEGAFIDTGAPHFVINFENLPDFSKTKFADFNLDSFAKEIRYHAFFQPEGTNVNIFQINDNCVFLRTYERGVEKETGACGTGALATGLVCSIKHRLNNPIRIIPTSGELLLVEIIHNEKGNHEKLALKGYVKILEEKTLEI